MTGFAHEIPFRTGGDVPCKPIPAEPVDDVGEAPLPYLCSVFRHVDLEELPVARRRIEPFLSLHHRLARYQLNDRSRWIDAPRLRVGDLQRGGAMTEEVVHVKLAYWGHLPDAAKRCRVYLEAAGLGVLGISVARPEDGGQPAEGGRDGNERRSNNPVHGASRATTGQHEIRRRHTRCRR